MGGKEKKLNSNICSSDAQAYVPVCKHIYITHKIEQGKEDWEKEEATWIGKRMGKSI